MVKRIVALVLLYGMMCCTIHAQLSIKGRVTDSKKEGLSDAIVKLYRDSVFITSSSADSLGYYKLQAMPRGSYHLQVIYLKSLVEGKPFKVTKDTVINVSITPSLSLGELVVKGRREKIRKIDGGISATIKNSFLSKIGNAFDVLTQLPLIQEKDDGIQIIGNGNPDIYINNRLVKDEDELRRLSSDIIQKVDIITNPGSEYASSTHSVIRIYTIPPRGTGISAKVQSYTMLKKRMSEFIDGEIGYFHNGLNLFLNSGFSDNRKDYERRTYYVLPRSTSEYHGPVEGNSRQINLTAGMSYDWKRQSAGICYECTGTPHDFEEKYLSVKEHGILTSSHNLTDKQVHNYAVNAYYNGKISNWGYEWNADYNVGNYQDKTVIEESNKPQSIAYVAKDQYNQFSTKLKVFHSATSHLLNGGLEYNYTYLKSTQKMLQDNKEEYLSDINTHNRQSLAAAFVSYRQSIGSFFLLGGLRLEYTDFDYYENGKMIPNQSKTYLSLLPNLTIGYNKDDLEMDINLKKYIDRPSYESLSNVTTYTSASTRWQGNPNLKSTNTFEINGTLLYKDLYVCGGMELIHDNIFEVNQLSPSNEEILIVKPQNLPTYKCYFIESSYNYDFAIWHPSVNAYVQFQNLTYGTPSKKYNGWLGDILLNNRFSFNHDWNLWLSFGYRTRGYYTIGYTYGYKNVGIMISKYFLHKLLQVKIEAKDIFNKGREKIRVLTNNVSLTDSSVGNTRLFRFTVIYTFNKFSNHYKGQGVSENELNRLRRKD